MSESHGMRAWFTRFANRWHARTSTRAKAVTAFVSQPEPRTIGLFARGRQLVAGNFLFAGKLVEDKENSLFALRVQNPAFLEEIHGFAWLDDLVAVGDGSARTRAQDWTWDWIEQFGRGTGPGWTPELTGRRLIRWINHAIFLLHGREKDQSDAFYRSLAQQTIFLSKRWPATRPGLPKFEALTGMIYAGLSLEGMEEHVDPAVRALAHECASQVDDQGGIPTRNPEELLEVFTLLTWAALALDEAGRTVPIPHFAAIERIAPTLRSLRHSDGSLARFHGGGKGLEGRLDNALAQSGVKTRPSEGLAMGFARISAGRTSVIIDAAPPPKGRASFDAHASTLAFELTSGRRPVISNCGSGANFGEDWRRAGRATPSHSTLCLEGYSSARLSSGDGARSEYFSDVPAHVPVEISPVPDGIRFQGGHDGWLKTHGLTHARTLELTFDGRGMVGEDLLVCLEDADRKRFAKVQENALEPGVLFQIRFHIHPEVDAELDMGGAAVSLALKSGELWVLRSDGTTALTLEPSIYMEKGRLKPRATKQVVLTGRAVDQATRVRWSLSKAQDTPISIRDLQMDNVYPETS
ncbi:heparinase II/III family protein [Alisedimentitalea sp. MJ-SS2]|uniref:heparinase II/III family protein n=1 Tax=Aliisedimentitalea sp. MJ-SS2 TaxID=3049795 RepID=UPI00291034BD|nr:heparinase II/III family protein [Alisedimentitalea sp. MJ-SS2]MDU8928022.1 heparinase II/III family protein [Alisedimentitalea sp. MJ-SS2]